MGAGQRDDALQRLPPPRGHRRRGQGPQLAHPAVGHRRAVPQRRDPRAAARARGPRRGRPRGGGQLRGVVPRPDGPDPLRAHPALHGEAMGTVGPRAVRALGAATGVRALGRRSLPVRRSLPGLARGARRLHRPDRRAACRRRDLRAPRHRRHARGRRRARAWWTRWPSCSPARSTSSAGSASARSGGAGSTSRRCPCRTWITRRARWSSTTPASSTPSSASTRRSTPPASSARGPSWASSSPTRRAATTPSRASATGRSTTATSPTCASRSARSGVLCGPPGQLPLHRHGRLHASGARRRRGRGSALRAGSGLPRSHRIPG